jgi:hypothetical protein
MRKLSLEWVFPRLGSVAFLGSVGTWRC